MLEYVPVKQDWLYRSPYFFFKSVRSLLIKYPRFKNNISIEFIGKSPFWLNDMIKEFKLEENFVAHGFVPYQASLKLQENVDLMLATSEKQAGGEHYCLPSKIFDYVIQRKPILGFVTEGIQKEFLEKSGLALICNPDDTDGTVEKLYRLLTRGGLFKPDATYINQFKRSELTNQFEKILQEAATR
jgi:glycosyltransferase involved in cell wall biosynthesis